MFTGSPKLDFIHLAGNLQSSAQHNVHPPATQVGTTVPPQRIQRDHRISRKGLLTRSKSQCTKRRVISLSPRFVQDEERQVEPIRREENDYSPPVYGGIHSTQLRKFRLITRLCEP